MVPDLHGLLFLVLGGALHRGVEVDLRRAQLLCVDIVKLLLDHFC